ncbi:cytochrome c oxidase assembly protein [Solicola sp. PLA-1-18]|uniref:cytochrome c oxidase assembly protein n=1 Tax=Solicola sp. PLA-1-18 TaxID=3380532 RepID=UPI003B7857D7
MTETTTRPDRADAPPVAASSVLLWAVAAAAACVGVLVVALTVGGGAPVEAPAGIPDPGRLTGWGLPIVKAATDTAGIVAVGMLLTAVFLLPSAGERLQGLAVRALGIASRAAWVWAAAGFCLFWFTISDTFARPFPGAVSGTLASQMVTETDLGRAIVAQVVLATLLAVATRWTVGVRASAALLGLALAAFAPQALTGHSAGGGSHDLAIASLLVHVLAAAVWVGGLAGLGLVAVRGSRRLAAAVPRFSTLALWAVVALGISGAVNAAVRLGGIGPVFSSSYGRLVLLKVVAIVTLAAFGWVHRRRTVPALVALDPDDGKARRAATLAFLRVAAVELVVMAGTVGLAVALSRTPTPVPDDLYQDPVEQLVGVSLPPAPDLGRLLLGWSPNGLGLLVVGLAAALYVKGLLVMRRRGDHWSPGRTASWFAGLVIIAWATFGGLGLYAHVLFSAHMVSHMMLSMVAPIFLVLGAPVTLALRTLPGPRLPGEVGSRQMLVGVLNSRVVSVLTHPLVAMALFIGSLYGLYFTGLFDVLMASHLGHAAMELHFLAVGSLYYYVIIGVDPSPRRLQPLIRFGMLLVTIPFHAFFSIAVMSSSTVMGASYWTLLQRPYQTSLLDDQYLGGGIAWAMGEVPLVLVMGALFVQWIRTDRREAQRHDRSEENGDKALEEYNAYLASLSQHEGRPSNRG